MSQASHWRIETDSDRVAFLILDRAGSSTNSLSSAVIRELAERLAELERAKPAAVVVCSGKANGFVAGRRASARLWSSRWPKLNFCGTRRRRHALGRHRLRPDRPVQREPVCDRLARDLGMAAVNRIGPLRRAFMQEAGGATGDLPRLLRGEAVV